MAPPVHAAADTGARALAGHAPAALRSGRAHRGIARVWASAMPMLQSDSLRRALVTVLALRVGLGLLSFLSLSLFGGLFYNPGPPYSNLFEPTSSHVYWLVFPWQRWDGLEYQYLASAGYHHASLQDIWFPLYPGIVHAGGSVLGHDYGLAALVVSTVVLVPALAVTHRLLSIDCGPQIADRALFYMAIAPQALFFIAPYTESLFLLLSATSFLLMRQGRFLSASIPIALATLTRPQGVFLLLPLAIELMLWLRRHRGAGRSLLWPGLGAPLLPVICTVAWLVEQARLFPGGLPALHAAWHKVLVPFGEPVVDGVRQLLAYSPGKAEIAVELLMMALLVATIPYMIKRLPPSYAAYAALSLIPMMVTETPTEPVTSNGRYALVLFPVFAALGAAGRRLWVDRAVVLTFTPMLVLATLYFAHYGKVG